LIAAKSSLVILSAVWRIAPKRVEGSAVAFLLAGDPASRKTPRMHLEAIG
jgi:hypothetical protein